MKKYIPLIIILKTLSIVVFVGALITLAILFDAPKLAITLDHWAIVLLIASSSTLISTLILEELYNRQKRHQ